MPRAVRMGRSYFQVKTAPVGTAVLALALAPVPMSWVTHAVAAAGKAATRGVSKEGCLRQGYSPGNTAMGTEVLALVLLMLVVLLLFARVAMLVILMTPIFAIVAMGEAAAIEG